MIELSLQRLQAFALNKFHPAKILETLPYLGLDIEGVEADTVSVEYSPNRPDFSSEAGVARTLLGMLEVQTGLPQYHFAESDYEIKVEGDEVRKIRPYVFGMYCDLLVTDEIIKELITMQEDLHNGLGRKRSSVAIGIHNADAMTNRITYRATRDAKYSFAPLGSTTRMSIAEILSSTEQGVKYGRILSEGIYPLLEDSEGNLLSMPPIINGERTRLKAGISRLFIDVTATDHHAGDAVTAIIASMLADVGGKVKTVAVVDSSSKANKTPDMTPREMKFNLNLSNNLLGFHLDEKEAARCLSRVRLELSGDGVAKIPRFRSDILHPVDLVEEVALGYGIARIEPLETSTSLSGSLHPKLQRIDRVVEALEGLGFTEVWNLSLIDRETVSSCADPLRVDDSKSQSFEYLRCELSTSLLNVLGGSSSVEYPQKIFEVAPVFSRAARANESGALVSEDVHVAAFVAGSDVNYTYMRSLLDAFLRQLPIDTLNLKLDALQEGKTVFLQGRSARVKCKDKDGNQNDLGVIGEVSPTILEREGILVPVAGFELNLEHIL